MEIISIKENQNYVNIAIKYIQDKWPDVYPLMYDDCIKSCLTSQNPIPQWYLLKDGDKIIGCAGLITNDFISRMDLYPWLCALYIEESRRGHLLSSLLIDRIKKDTLKFGFDRLYLCTQHEGFYEKLGFSFVAEGYHPWEEASKIYEIKLSNI